MKSSHLTLASIFAIIFLFFIQSSLTLIESVYILDLMNTTLDEKALGMLFFLTPLLLLFMPRSSPRWLLWALFAALAISRGLLPHLSTEGRLPAAGIATTAALLLFPLLLAEYLHPTEPRSHTAPAAGLALAVAASVALRSYGHGLDISLEPAGSLVGWILGVALGFFLAYGLPAKPSPGSTDKTHKGISDPGRRVGPAALGLFSILGLVMFSISSPGVIARWTEGSYSFIFVAVSALSLLSMLFILLKPGWLSSLRPLWLLAWNLLFTIAITALIASHTIAFPPTPSSPPVIVAQPTPFQNLLLGITLLLFPVIYVNFMVFTTAILSKRVSLRMLAPGLFFGGLFLVLMIFINVFSNVWGYVEPVSPLFRNTFWLAFLLMAGLSSLLGWRLTRREATPLSTGHPASSPGWLAPGILAATIFLVVAVSLLRASKPSPPPTGKDTLVLMTYNIQAANDGDAQKSYERQHDLIRQVNPDILALQESDTTRISLANNDYVRYYADRLGYYAYFGPKTVTGTFGTALLSKYPLENPRTIFSYSDEDEIGTVEAEIVVDGRRFTIYNVHPAGSDTAMMAFAQVLLSHAAGKQDVIILGDFNLRQSQQAYQLIAASFQNAWLSVYPSGIDDDGLDMSGDKRIDHIFLSPSLHAQDAVYLLSPASATDHPAHWAAVDIAP